LSPLLIGSVVLPELIISTHSAECTACHRTDRRTFPRVTPNRASDCAHSGAAPGTAKRSGTGRLLDRRWTRGLGPGRGVESGLLCGPRTALPFVGVLLLCTLALGRIDEEVISQGCSSSHDSRTTDQYRSQQSLHLRPHPNLETAGLNPIRDPLLGEVTLLSWSVVPAHLKKAKLNYLSLRGWRLIFMRQ
jgi:hypothetical protein